MQTIGLRIILKRIKAIRFLLADKTVPKRKKALVIFGIIYLFLPTDLIPAILFPFGILDDLILWIFIIWHLKDELDSYWLGDKSEDLSKKFHSSDVIDGVDFSVEDDGSSNKKDEKNDKDDGKNDDK
jgi:Uncharacterized conserved protein